MDTYIVMNVLLWVLASMSAYMTVFGIQNTLLGMRYKQQAKSTAYAVNYDPSNGRFKVFVEFTHDGKKHKTSFLTPVPTKRGSKVVFYINPENPEDAYWASPSNGLFWLGGGLVGLVLSALLFRRLYGNHSRKRKGSR